ncbi:M24 family metallopeptidase [Marinobacter caseinilyticus]|uniref:M24 family metallopeptidase n=1 Tax=Marinobacter caseinilyticus TaxID=2692195 RepID=UPI001409D111|nr:Xaa-Pro peptidase family protein [Marinobacter caseinilyticus]
MDHAAYSLKLAEQLRGTELAFLDSEFNDRRLKVRTAMISAGFDALLITDPSDIYYLTGYNTFEVSVHTCLVLSDHHTFLQVPSIEIGPAVVTAVVDEVLGYRWENLADVIDPLCDALAGFYAIGIDSWSPTLRHGILTELQTRLGPDRFHPGGELLDRIRIVKSAAELTCLRESARITSAGLQGAIEILRPGLSDNEIAAEGARVLLREGSEFMSMQPIVTSGKRISVIHTNHRRQPIRNGDPVFLEFGSSFKRYTAPMMCTAVAGRATPQMMRLRDTCRALFDALLPVMRPGHTFHDAAVAAEQVLAPMRDEVFFSGVFGYSVGAQFPPSWVEGTGYIARNQHQAFEANMVFHLPLCLRRPGEWGIGISDTVRVTDTGGEALTDNHWRLQEYEP